MKQQSKFNGMKFTQWLILLALLAISTSLFAKDQLREELYCSELDRVLTAKDFVEYAREFEVALSLLPDDFSYTSVQEFGAANPNCCEVRWFGQPFPGSWWDQFFYSPPVQTTIIWTSNTEVGNELGVTYLQSQCGIVQGRLELEE